MRPLTNHIVRRISSSLRGNHRRPTLQLTKSFSILLNDEKLSRSEYPSLASLTNQYFSTTSRNRRRHRGESSSDNVSKIPNVFLPAAIDLLGRIQKALEPMKEHNDVFRLERSSNDIGPLLTLELKPGEGTYLCQVDEAACTVILTSPMSGTYTYVLLPPDKFVGMGDGHSLEGMIVRDLIRHCNGLPNF